MEGTHKSMQKKQLVSWTDYAKHVGVKTGASAFATILYTIGGMGLLMALVCLLAVVFSKQQGSLFVGLIGAALIGTLSSVLIYYGRVAHHEVREIPRLAPITTKNIVELPLQETLVRGSSEPVSLQQDILLRPADGVSKTQEQELLLPR